MYYNVFVDIGRVVRLECVKAARRNAQCELLAVGERGECRIPAMVAYSKIIPDAIIGNARVHLFDLGVISFFQRVRSMLDGQDYLNRLKRGAQILLPDLKESLRILKSCDMGGWNNLAAPRKWVNAAGEPIPEPEEFLMQFQMCAFCSFMRDMYLGHVDESRFVDELSRITMEYAGSVRSEDFDFMIEWYDALDAAARTINHHIDVDDYKPNSAKIEKLIAVYNRDPQRLDKLVVRDSYAEHLHERSHEVFASLQAKWHTRIGTVERFSSVKFPGDRRI